MKGRKVGRIERREGVSEKRVGDKGKEEWGG